MDDVKMNRAIISDDDMDEFLFGFSSFRPEVRGVKNESNVKCAYCASLIVTTENCRNCGAPPTVDSSQQEIR